MRNLTMATDFYELTMMYAYFLDKKAETKVTFNLFFRRNPFGSAYTIAAGLEQIIEYVKDLHFATDDIDYLRSLNVFNEDFLAYLSTFKFTGSISAVPEGTVIFPMEPAIVVTAPVIEAQLVETLMLTYFNHQSLIATKAARIRHEAPDKVLLEGGLRRAQGPDAGILGARAAIIGGCDSTSNVLAGKLYDIPVGGTFAHSYVMFYEDEALAFNKYGDVFENCICLVDTYDTLYSGVKNAIKLFDRLSAENRLPVKHGIRLDSGDIAYLSKEARKILNAAGYPNAVIVASNDLDEMLIQSLKTQGSEVNTYLVGTNLITAKDCPALGGVYKLAAVGNSPRIKVSENIEKTTIPGEYEIVRLYTKDLEPKLIADLLVIKGENVSTLFDLTITHPIERWKKKTLPSGTFDTKRLLVEIFRDGACVYESPNVMEIKKVCDAEKGTLSEENLRILNPHPIHVDLSDKLYDLRLSMLEKARNNY